MDFIFNLLDQLDIDEQLIIHRNTHSGCRYLQENDKDTLHNHCECSPESLTEEYENYIKFKRKK